MRHVFSFPEDAVISESTSSMSDSTSHDNGGSTNEIKWERANGASEESFYIHGLTSAEAQMQISTFEPQ